MLNLKCPPLFLSCLHTHKLRLSVSRFSRRCLNVSDTQQLVYPGRTTTRPHNSVSVAAECLDLCSPSREEQRKLRPPVVFVNPSTPREEQNTHTPSGSCSCCGRPVDLSRRKRKAASSCFSSFSSVSPSASGPQQITGPRCGADCASPPDTTIPLSGHALHMNVLTASSDV